MPWMKIAVEEQKVRFGWWRRYEEAGLAGLSERSRRPKQSPRRTVAELERRVVELRQRYPDWGARKLQVLLAREQVAMTLHRPSHSVATQPGARSRPPPASSRALPARHAQ
jgi:hypothetical protein